MPRSRITRFSQNSNRGCPRELVYTPATMTTALPATASILKERRAWYWYDWANSAFTTTVVTLFFGPFITSVAKAAADAQGNVQILGLNVEYGAYWGWLVSLSVITQVLVLPVLGQIADSSPRKKWLLAGLCYTGAVATVGMLQVPNGSINVVPGKCQFSLDLRAPTNAQRDALMKDMLRAIDLICERRGVRYNLEETMRASAAPSDAKLQALWEHAVQALGVPVFHLPSGAGHDAMKLHECMPQAMLFVRGGNEGISHNPLETITAHDAQLCVDAMLGLLEGLAQ